MQRLPRQKETSKIRTLLIEKAGFNPAFSIEMISYLLKIKEIKKNKVEKRIIKGPAGKPVVLKSKMPKKQLKMPKAALPKKYPFKLLLRFLAVAAGMITNAPTKREPTIFIPKATNTAIESK